jgi:hypothetical protein
MRAAQVAAKLKRYGEIAAMVVQAKTACDRGDMTRPCSLCHARNPTDDPANQHDTRRRIKVHAIQRAHLVSFVTGRAHCRAMRQRVGFPEEKKRVLLP